MALKGIFKWGPGEQFGFIENELRLNQGKRLEGGLGKRPEKELVLGVTFLLDMSV